MIQLRDATRMNLAYHRFMWLMLGGSVPSFCRLASIITACCRSMGRVSRLMRSCTGFGLIFECVSFSTLNFTFFGYGDITPQTIPAKLMAITEVHWRS